VVFFLKMLLPHISTYEFKKDDFEDYFICVGKLLIACSQEELNKIMNPSELLNNVLHLIYRRPMYEERISDYEDKVLAGLLYIACSIFKICPNLKAEFESVEEVWHN
jgi:hypothetical protein